MQNHFILKQKRFLLTFLLSGITYALLTLIIDKANVSQIVSWGFLIKGIIFGFFIALANLLVKNAFTKEDRPKSWQG